MLDYECGNVQRLHICVLYELWRRQNFVPLYYEVNGKNVTVYSVQFWSCFIMHSCSWAWEHSLNATAGTCTEPHRVWLKPWGYFKKQRTGLSVSIWASLWLTKAKLFKREDQTSSNLYRKRRQGHAMYLLLTYDIYISLQSSTSFSYMSTWKWIYCKLLHKM